MKSTFKDRSGQKLGGFQVVQWSHKKGETQFWDVLCIRCNKMHVRSTAALLNNVSGCCGAANRTHGMTGTPTYRTWIAMIQRCTDPNAGNFARYGGVGVAVCERWRNSFSDFLEDMGERPEGMSIDRIDGTRGYEPSNCRWATSKQQSRNVRSNRDITAFGKTQCVAAWAEQTGIPERTIRARLASKSGWTNEQIVSTPVGGFGYGRRSRSD